VGQDGGRLELLLAALAEHRSRGGLILLACHEPEVVVSSCQRVLFLEQGRLLIDAPVAEAMARLARMGRVEYLPAGYGRKKVDGDGPF